MAWDAFYRKDWAAMADTTVERMNPKDAEVVRRIFKQKKNMGNSERDLEKTARDIYTFWVQFVKPKALADMSREELQDIFGKIFRSDKSYYTIKDYRKHLLQFYRELQGDDFNPLHYYFMRGGDKVMKAKKSRLTNSREVLDQNEIKQLVNAATNWRDKAYVMVSFDLMVRVGSLLRLKMKDVKRQGKDIWLTFEKTKEEEAFKAGLTISEPAFSKWLALHPDPRPDQFVFCARRKVRQVKIDSEREEARGERVIRPTNYGMLDYNALRDMLKTLMLKAGIKKHLHAHIFRGSGSTFWKKMGANDQIIEKRGGWAAGSKALRETYLVFQKEESHEMTKSLISGIKPEMEKPIFSPTACVKCGWTNDKDVEFCFNCNRRLSLEGTAKESNRLEQVEAELASIKEKLLVEKTAARIQTKRMKSSG